MPMTAHAKSLTARATPPDDGIQTWSMPSRDVNTLVTAFGQLGYDTGPLVAALRLGDADLQDPDARVPCEALGAVVSTAQRQRFTANLGFEVARVTPLGAYPLLDYLVVTSDTVGSGVRQLAHYSRLIGNPIVLEVHDEAEDHVRVDMGAGAASFSLEFLASLMVLHLRNETGGRLVISEIAFQHTPDDIVEFERAVGCTIRAPASWNGLTVPRSGWELPLRRRDAVLRHVLEAHADDILARLPRRTGFALEVQRALASQMPDGDTRIAAVARHLAMSGRTLQRRLAAHGVSYQELLDEARKEAAERYLREQTLAICEVAYLVGYSEPAPFYRAFKRWFGVTPEAFRHTQRRPAR